MSDALWRFDWAPTPEEWQAVWAMLGVMAALLLLYVAWKQLSGLAESNRQLARSNELLTESNKSLSRPIVVVEFEFRVPSNRNYNGPNGTSKLFIVIKNVGQAPARDLKLQSDPQFESASPAMFDKALSFLRERFSGDLPIRMLTPGQRLTYALDDASVAIKSRDLPAEYKVNTSYTDITGREMYGEELVLQLSPWALSVADQDPMKRISKDIQFIAEILKDSRKGLPKIASNLNTPD